MLAPHPKEQKKLAKDVKIDKEEWHAIGQTVAEMVNYAKFTQQGRLKATLLRTGERMLCEAASRDKVWGIGLNENAARITWKGGRTGEWGMNLFGKALMAVREKIQREEEEEGRGRGAWEHFEED